MASKAIVVFSGGPDSTAAALWAIANGYEVELLTFDFKAQKQYGEIASAVKVATRLKLKHTIIDFRSPMASFGDKVHILMHAGTEVGLADQTSDHRMPFGGGMILSTASCYATYNGVNTVIWGANLDDSVGNPYEYTEEFGNYIAKIVSQSIGCPFSILTPFSGKPKAAIAVEFLNDADLFADTWSCKVESQIQCGECKACVARRAASAAVGLQDNSNYIKPTFDNPIGNKSLQDVMSMDPVERGVIFGSEKPTPGG